MRLLCCGGRKFDDLDTLRRALYPRLVAASTGKMVDKDKNIERYLFPLDYYIIHGMAEGADKLSEVVAKEMGFQEVQFLRYPAKWEKHGKSAGPIRNRTMLVEGRPDEVFAFHWSPFHFANSKGTKDMVKISLEANIPTFLHTPKASYKMSLCFEGDFVFTGLP